MMKVVIIEPNEKQGERNSILWFGLLSDGAGILSCFSFTRPLSGIYILCTCDLYPATRTFKNVGNAILYFLYSFYSRNFVLHLPHLLQVERYKWAIYQRCMRARWRRRWQKFHQLLKLIKVSDRSETFFQFIIITIIIIIIISVSEEDEFLLNRRPKP